MGCGTVLSEGLDEPRGGAVGLPPAPSVPGAPGTRLTAPSARLLEALRAGSAQGWGGARSCLSAWLKVDAASSLPAWRG